MTNATDYPGKYHARYFESLEQAQEFCSHPLWSSILVGEIEQVVPTDAWIERTNCDCYRALFNTWNLND